MDEKKINYIENIEQIFHALTDMKLTKKSRAAIANMLEVMAINGYAACEQGTYPARVNFAEDVMFYTREAAK